MQCNECRRMMMWLVVPTSCMTAFVDLQLLFSVNCLEIIWSIVLEWRL